MNLAEFDHARAGVAATGFDDTVQTRIALFVGAAKSINATFLGALEWVPGMTVAQEFIHTQCFREWEQASLFARLARWTPNPVPYAEGAAMVAPLWAALATALAPPGPLRDPRACCRGLALGHALLARVRITPVIPADADEMLPFVVALRRLDQENGRQIQTQIRLLQDVPTGVPEGEREGIVQAEQARVDAAFGKLLAALARGAG